MKKVAIIAAMLVLPLFGTNVADAQEQKVEDLTLTSVCSANPDVTRKWRVQNTNEFAIEFTYEVVGTAQTGALVAPAAGEGVIKFPGATDGADYMFFETDTVAGANTTKIFWNDEETTKASSGSACDSFFQFEKVWTGDQVDASDVVVEFTADDDFSWTLGVDEPVQVAPGETQLTNVKEVVSGLPENCTYTSDLPSEIMAPNTGYDDLTNTFTLTVTNEVDCEEEGEVLGEQTPTATPVPVGGVNTGAGGASNVSSVAILGLISSAAAVGFGLYRFKVLS